MRQQVRFEDVQVGDQVPSLSQNVEAATLVRYAGASEDYVPLHWNHLHAVEQGLPGVIVHGWLTFAYMCRSVTDWIPREIADVSNYAVRYHRPNFLGVIHCSGEVVAKHEEDGVRKIDFNLQAKTDAGEVTTSAKLTLTFP